MHLSKPILAVLLAGIAAAGLVTTTLALSPQSFSFLGFKNTTNGNFTISSSPHSLGLQGGSSSTVTLTLVSTNGFDATISMSVSIDSGPQSSLTATLNQAMISIKPGEPGTNYLEITATTAASPGHYNATVSATSGSISHLLTISITVAPRSPDFEMGVAPSTIDASQTTNATLTVVSLLGFAGNVSLSSSITPQVGGGPTISFVNNSLIVSPTKPASTIVTITISTATANGNYTLGLYGSSGPLHRSVFIPLTIARPLGEILSLGPYSFSSGSNVTLYLRNVGHATVQLTAYYVKDVSGDQYSNVAWNGPSINVSSVGTANVLIPPDCTACTQTGLGFNFTSGNSYTVVFVTARNSLLTYTLTFTVREALNLDSYTFPTNMSVTLYIRNSGTSSVNFTSYKVADSGGNSYSFANWSGPVISPNQVVATTFYIGSGCFRCTLTGSYFDFRPGYAYTVTVFTARGNQFSFAVTD